LLFVCAWRWQINDDDDDDDDVTVAEVAEKRRRYYRDKCHSYVDRVRSDYCKWNVFFRNLGVLEYDLGVEKYLRGNNNKKPVLLQAKPRDAAINLNKQLMTVNILFSCLIVHKNSKPATAKPRYMT